MFWGYLRGLLRGYLRGYLRGLLWTLTCTNVLYRLLYGLLYKLLHRLVHGPFAVYLGWITVATIANASVVLYSLGWTGLGIAGPTWAVILLVIATCIGAAIVLGRAGWGYGVVLVWAFIGIVIKYAATWAIAVTAGVTAAIMVLLIVLALIRRPARGSGVLLTR